MVAEDCHLPVRRPREDKLSTSGNPVDLPRGRASIGYWLARRHRGRGIARQALGMISTWGSSLPGVRRLELSIDPGNEASWRTAESAGYQREGFLRSWQQPDGTHLDMYLYTLLARRRG